MQMDANELLIFAKVVQYGSFTAAARQLGQPKSTLSRKLASLEKRLGVRLLQRSTRRLRLTEVGQAYYQRCAAIASQMEEAETAVSSMLHVPQGKLKITTTVEFGVFYLEPILNMFLKQHPKINAHIELTERLVDLIGEDIDIAIRMGELDESSLTARRIGNSAMRLVASPAYIKKNGVPKKVADLEKHDCIIFTGPHPDGIWELLGPGNVKEEVHVQGRITSNSLSMVREATLAGEGITLLPPYAVEHALQKGELVAVLPEWATRNDPISIVFPSSRLLLPKVRVFVDFLAENFSKCASMAGDTDRGPLARPKTQGKKRKS